ncbi:MAG: hypothetical protein PHV43_01130 [Candidatus Colwellbacteria bacterium]|nr:hypothetical protein [Candidatus Colwellbacteria bacterium]
MAEKLKLALKNPALPLTLKAGFLALAVFWLRYWDLSLWRAFVFVLIFLYLYFHPQTNSTKFAISSAVWLGVVLQAPNLDGLLGFYLDLILSVLAFTLLGVKNLLLVRRQGAYYLLHLMLIVGVASLFFLGSISQIVLFIVLFFLIREFYLFSIKESLELINLIATAESMLLIEAAWIISFFPTSFLVGASFLVLITFVLHDALINHFRGTLNRQLIIRDLGLFTILIGLILLMPVWGFQ